MSFEASVKSDQEHPVIVLRDTGNGTEAEIYAFGGLLNAYRVKVGGRSMDLVDGFSSPADARLNIVNGFKSVKLSPFVCRMRDGAFRLAGRSYTIEKFYLGQHAIHGLLFDQVFEVISTSNTATHAAVLLEARYDGSDQGFPFPYQMQVEWKLESHNKITVTTTVSHQNKQAIPYTDGWHPYFTLGGAVDEWSLQFSSSGQLEYDADLLPTGKVLADDRFENGISLAGIVLDNSFVQEGKNKRCTLANTLLQLHIEPDDSYPFLQIYTPQHRKSIAIENLSGPPDNFNNNMHLLLLEPGTTKTFRTSYQAEVL